MSLSAKFEVNQDVVYPAHGVGKIQAIESQEIAGHSLNVFVVMFEQGRMTVKIPVNKAQSKGLRPLSSTTQMKKAIEVMKGKAVVRRAIWSRRAAEYETKINSGNPLSIAEVIRDLHRSAADPEPSYSEREFFQSALERLAQEFAAIEHIAQTEASDRLKEELA